MTEARHDGYLYRCKVTNAAGRVYSSVAGLAVTLKPIITQQPVTVTVDEGQTATFAVKATGEDLTYLWQYRKPGEETWRDVKKKGTSATYSLVTEIRHNGYAYRCKVTNAAGSVFSSSAKLTVKPALTITTQPANLETTANREVSFKVVAVGATGYQWEYLRPDETTWRVVSKNGTSATYSLLALFRRDGFKYRCKVSNATSFLYSYAATLTVRVKPSITVQPRSITVYGGKNATFTVVAQGGGLAYKWQYQEAGKTDWIDVERNGTSASCTFKAYLNFNGRKYRCWISNTAGNITSSAVTLTVSEKPVITTQPQDATAKEDTSVTFWVEADGATAFTWQYKKPGEDTWYNVTRNGNASVYRMTAQLRHNGYSYRCRVSNDKGSVLSSEARLTVTPHPVITAQPKDVKVLAGQKAEFKVTATGEAPMSYLWQYQKPGESTWNDVKKNGTSATYALTVEARHDGYSYRCRVSNDGGYVFAGPAKLTVISQPVITADPKDVSVKAGQEAKFTVKATGGDLSYQWQYQKPGENTWNDVKKNGTSATYTLTAETRHNGYAYRCKVTNQAGSATSKSAKLTVR